MIETNEVGNKQIRELIEKIDQGDFTEWEENFIRGLKYRDYDGLSAKQKALVSELYEEVK